MVMKPRILYLMQYLQENSDEKHPVTTAEIRKELEKRGCPVTVITLRTDIQSLIEAGYDIGINEREGLSTTYSWLDREWSLPELRILVDAVSSSQFLTKEKSRQLIGKLAEMAGPSYRDQLTPRILVSEHVKAPNKQILLSVQTIHRAIERERKITFKYMEHDLDMKLRPRHAGTPEENYIVSPYATIWNSDRYYLVGWSDRRRKVSAFRVDRMTEVKQINRKRVPEPDWFNVQDYTDKVFWMYGGYDEEVTLRCRRELLDQVIDKFGEGVTLENVTKTFFDVTVPVSVSGTFFAWVFQYAGDMNIINPPDVREKYASRLDETLADTLA